MPKSCQNLAKTLAILSMKLDLKMVPRIIQTIQNLAKTLKSSSDGKMGSWDRAYLIESEGTSQRSSEWPSERARGEKATESARWESDRQARAWERENEREDEIQWTIGKEKEKEENERRKSTSFASGRKREEGGTEERKAYAFSVV